ncbi:hypothetical protein C9374_013055 [Naegleria lovaniensis]|uniref:RNase H type-1 domain-containing protein n=1 Tax=Naegleria lovaniensis TaxID=51637 RepID=A0AA88KC28_NAELO|nr:uncharacterized protein C9374_013055 [Naegleria lovaniensis]KAG2372933.1 hypothetical protein C9374_013055 [Naegleria lovaniensis]
MTVQRIVPTGRNMKMKLRNATKSLNYYLTSVAPELSVLTLNINGLRAEPLSALKGYLNSITPDIIMLQEVKSVYIGPDFPSIYYSSFTYYHDPRDSCGVSICLNKSTFKDIEEIILDPIIRSNARIIGAKCKVNSINTLVISAYFPNQPADRCEFTYILDDLIEKYPNHKIIIGGDYNAILSENHSSNESRRTDQNILDLINKRNLNYYPFPHLSWHLHYTINKQSKSIIDYISTDFPIASGEVLNANFISDHKMVKILLDLSCQRTPLLIRKKRNFQDPKNKKEVLAISKECVSQVKNLETDNDKWLFICDKLGDKFVEVNPPKLDPKIYKYNKQYKKLMLILDRSEHGYPCDKLLATIGKTLEQVPKCLASVKEKIKNHIKWSHDKALNRKMKWWEQNYATNSKHLRKKIYKTSSPPYKLSIDGTEINDPNEVANVIKDKYQQNLNFRGRNHQIDITKFFKYKHPLIDNCNDKILGRITTEEKEWIIQNLKSTAPNELGLRQKTIKYMCNELQEEIFQIIENIITTGFTPESMQSVSILPIHKKNKDHSNPANYRPIALMDSGLKIATKLITKRLKEGLKGRLSIAQFGGEDGRETIHRVLSIYNMIAWAKKDKKPFYGLAVDIKKAYDSLPRIMLRDGLLFLGIDEITADGILEILGESTTKFVIPNGKSECFTVKDGLKQGDTFSPLAFKIALEPLLQFLEITYNGASVANYWNISTGAWIDDLNSFSNELPEIENSLHDIETYLHGYHMELDHSKTNLFSDKECSIKTLSGSTIKSNDSVIILGNNITNNTEEQKKYTTSIIEEVKRRTNSIGWNFPIQNIVKIINTDIVPYALYHLIPLANDHLEKQIDKFLRNFICERLRTKRKLALEWFYTHQDKGGLGLISVLEMSYSDLMCKVRKFLEQYDICLGSSTRFLCERIKQEHGFDILNDPIPTWYKPDPWIPQYLKRIIFMNKSSNIRLWHSSDQWHEKTLIPYGKFPKGLRQFLLYKDWNRLSMWVPDPKNLQVKLHDDIKHSNHITQIRNILNSMDFGKIKDESKYYKYVGNNTSLSNLLNKATLIGTDGSCNNNIAGYGIVTDQNVSISSHTLGQGTAYNSEVQALHTAVRLLDNNTPRTIVIDAKSIYDQLFQFRKSRDPYVEEIRNYLKVKDQIKIMHVNSHTGKQDIYSRINELADRAAKKGADCNNILTNIPSNNWYIIINNVLYTQNTRQTMYKLLFQHLHKRTYTPKNLPPKNRKFTNIYPSIGIGFRTINLIFKIRVNVMKTLENLNKISKTNLLCPCCSRETMQHIIFECKYYSDIRKEMFRNLYNISIYAKNNRKFSKRLLYLIKTKQDIHSLTGAKVGLGKKWDKVFTKEAYRSITKMWMKRNHFFMEELKLTWNEFEQQYDFNPNFIDLNKFKLYMKYPRP